MGIFGGRVLGCAVLLATLVGCSAQPGASDPLDGQFAPPPPSTLISGRPVAGTPTPVVSTVTSRPPTVTPRPPETAPIAATPTVAPIHNCAARDLAASGQKSSGGLFVEDDERKWISRVFLHNTGQSPCLLKGWPGLTLYGYDIIEICLPEQPKPCGSGVKPNERRPLTLVRSRVRPASDVLLAPGQTTSFAMLWVSAFAGTCIHGDAIPPYRAEIRVPGDSHPIPLQGPAVQPCEDLIEVTTFGSGI
ncbi:hypothetical protein [Streptomyces sp. NPDC002758]